MTASLDRSDAFLDVVTLKAVALYDHFNSGCRAKVFFDQLRSRSGREVQFSLALWRMDVLQIPGGLGAALRDFGCADILALALQAESVLPPPVVEWIDSWARFRGEHDSALVVLWHRLSCHEDEFRSVPGILREVRDVASRYRVSFFCEWPPEPSSESVDFVDLLRQREKSMTATMGEILAQAGSSSHRHWGLNE